MSSTPLFQPRFSLKSWHARLYQYVWENGIPRRISICRYFWTTVLSIILLPLVASANGIEWLMRRISPQTKRKIMDRTETTLKVLAYGMAAVGFGLGGYAAYYVLIHNLAFWWVPFAATGIITAVFFLGWGIYELVDKIRYTTTWHDIKFAVNSWFESLSERYKAWEQKRPKKPKVEKIKPPKPVKPPRKPSMFWAYLKAKKGQVCPTVEWVERSGVNGL